LQKLQWRPSVSPYGTPLAAAALTGRFEYLGDFTGRSEGQKAGEKNAPLFLEDQNQKYFLQG
jgi:hypothetical protein